MAGISANPHVRLSISLPASQVARLESGSQSVSSRISDLLEIGLSGGVRYVLKQNIVIRPGTLRHTPLPLKRQKTPQVRKRIRTAPKVAARPAGMSWGPGAGLGPGPPINLDHYKNGVYVGPHKKAKKKTSGSVPPP